MKIGLHQILSTSKETLHQCSNEIHVWVYCCISYDLGYTFDAIAEELGKTRQFAFYKVRTKKRTPLFEMCYNQMIKALECEDILKCCHESSI